MEMVRWVCLLGHKFLSYLSNCILELNLVRRRTFRTEQQEWRLLMGSRFWVEPWTLLCRWSEFLLEKLVVPHSHARLLSASALSATSRHYAEAAICFAAAAAIFVAVMHCLGLSQWNGSMLEAVGAGFASLTAFRHMWSSCTLWWSFREPIPLCCFCFGFLDFICISHLFVYRSSLSDPFFFLFILFCLSL